MKKVRLITMVTILALLLALVPVAFAGPPPGNWVSGIACQNLSSVDPASVTLYFYQEGNSTPVLQYDDPNPIPPNGSRNYYTPSSPPGVPEGFLGSVVVASNTPMACNVNTQTTGAGTTSDPYRIGTSAGFADTETSPTMYAPQVMKTFGGTWSSYIAVQNTTTAAVDVTISYKDRFGGSVGAATETMNIPGQSNHVFYQTDNAGLPANFLGAATIEADDGTSGLAVTVNFYNSGSSSSTAQLHSYNGFAGGANKLFVPRIVRNYYGYNGGLSIQNVGGSATTVSIVFNFAGNTYNYNSPSIAPGAALALYAPDMTALAPVDALNETLRFGSATITAAGSGQVVAIVNEDNRGGAGIPAERVGQGSSYNAMPEGSQTDTVFFAQITRRASGIYSGGFQVANTTATAGKCDIAFSGAAAANQNDVTLPANGSFRRYAPDVPNLPDGFNASVTVTCDKPVVAISNLAVGVGTGRYGDSFTQSNGLNE
jgi:hypothetical protein